MTDTQTFSYGNSFKCEILHQTYKSLNGSIIELTTPSITIGSIIQPTAIKELYHIGDSLAIDPISIAFILDEDYGNYFTLFNWLNAIKNFHELDDDKTIITDIAIHILTNKMNSESVMILEDCFPTTLSEISLSSQIPDNDPIVFSSSFMVNNITIS